MFGWVLLGLLVGGAVVALAYTVSEIIRRSNLGALIRGAFRNAKEAAARKALGKTIRAEIKKKSVNEVSIRAFADDEAIDVNITSPMGVDSSIHVGDVCTVMV